LIKYFFKKRKIEGGPMKRCRFFKYVFSLTILLISMIITGCSSKSGGGVTGPTLFVAAEGVFKSMDGGQSWSNVLGSVPFVDVSFSDANHGCATRIDAIHCTEDGGDSWPHETAMATRIFFVQMMSEKVGYAFGDGKLYRTTDSGVSWINVPFGDITAYGMQFLSQNVGYIFGATLLKTSDGGASWEIVLHPINTITSVFFTSETRGYLGSFESEFFATSDGASSWETRPGPSGFTFDNMAFSTSLPDFGVAGDDNYGLIMTTDAGLNWQKEDFSSLSIVKDVAVTGDRTVYAVGGTGANKGILAVTEDGGATWTELEIDGAGEAKAISVIQ
jgi:photosystem II stability/assembly factor-like uncharacterized protein